MTPQEIDDLNHVTKSLAPLFGGRREADTAIINQKLKMGRISEEEHRRWLATQHRRLTEASLNDITEILERQLPVAGALLAIALIIMAIGLWS